MEGISEGWKVKENSVKEKTRTQENENEKEDEKPGDRKPRHI